MSMYDSLYRHVVYPLRERRSGSRLLADVRRYRKWLEQPPERWRELQSRGLSEIVRHAAATSPFWTARFRQSGIYRIAPGEGRQPLPDDLDFLRAETKHYLGHEAQVDFEVVDALPEEASGKHMVCRSTAAREFLSTRQGGS